MLLQQIGQLNTYLTIVAQIHVLILAVACMSDKLDFLPTPAGELTKIPTILYLYYDSAAWDPTH